VTVCVAAPPSGLKKSVLGLKEKRRAVTHKSEKKKKGSGGCPLTLSSASKKTLDPTKSHKRGEKREEEGGRKLAACLLLKKKRGWRALLIFRKGKGKTFGSTQAAAFRPEKEKGKRPRHPTRRPNQRDPRHEPERKTVAISSSVKRKGA